MVDGGIEQFNFHNLKVAGIRDTDKNKQDGWHRDAKIVAIYDRKKMQIKPSTAGFEPTLSCLRQAYFILFTIA